MVPYMYIYLSIKFTDRVDYGYFKPRDMTQLQKTDAIIEELDEEKVEVDVESTEGVEKKEIICRGVIESSYKHSRNTFKTKKY